MDRLIAFEEVVASEAIEFVDSSNVVFFLPGDNDGVLYVGFTDSFVPESDPVPLATTEYLGEEELGCSFICLFQYHARANRRNESS